MVYIWQNKSGENTDPELWITYNFLKMCSSPDHSCPRVSQNHSIILQLPAFIKDLGVIDYSSKSCFVLYKTRYGEY